MTVVYILAVSFVVNWADIPNVARVVPSCPMDGRPASFLADWADFYTVAQIGRLFLG